MTDYQRDDAFFGLVVPEARADTGALYMITSLCAPPPLPADSGALTQPPDYKDRVRVVRCTRLVG